MELSWITERSYNISPTSPFLIASLTVIVTMIYYYIKNKNLPPGPIGLPFLGYWPFLNSKDCCPQLAILKKKYGNFYSFTSTGHLFISLGSFRAVREAHLAKSDCFGGRFEEFNLLTAVFADGVGFMNGDGWRCLRKFLLQSFKERGILSMKDNVSRSMQDAIASTVKDLREKKDGEPVNILELLTNKCTSIMRVTLFGEEGVSEQQIREINDLYGSIMECMSATNLLLTGNIARYLILPRTSGYSQFKKNHKLIEEFLFKIVDEHKATYNEDNIRDVIDEYIKERNEKQSKGDPTVKHFTDRALVVTLIQIVGDGVLSVAAFIALFIKMIFDYPEEQDKIYKEVVEVVGLDRLPTVADKSKLKYTNAFIMEGLRTSNFFPFFPSMQCTKETTLRGHRIPVGTITLMNTWSVHNDPKEYEDPERFNPSRFLDEEGKKRPELPITFGVGKRACVGEAFTMNQVFLFMTSLIQNFHVKLLNENEETTVELLFSGKFKILVEPRIQET